jgi:hypothetical protein
MKTPAVAGQRLRLMPGDYAVCRLAPSAAMPEWATGSFVSLTRTPEELTVVCPARQVPTGVVAERGWRLLQLVGPFPFTTTGVLAAIAQPLARARISVLPIATYDTDYFLIKDEVYRRAVAALRRAGHRVGR